MKAFADLGICEPILRVIAEKKFEQPTEIQARSIPLILQGKDVIGGSATGSGKTLAFGSGIIQNSERARGVQALVLCPTRELAEQVYKTLKEFSRYKKLNLTVVYGGVSINPQIDSLQDADIVVGTPGRVLDHLERETLNLSECKYLVLDEADVMLDMGFIEDVSRIIMACPKERQTMLFSATISTDINNLIDQYMNDPVKIDAENLVDPKKLTQVFYNVPDNMKFSLLVGLLKKEKGGLVMVFCNTRRNADFVAKNLKLNQVEATAIHGGLSQYRRNNIMEHFHSQQVFVLVCTDVAARGLDIKGISHVYNYDIPNESKQYIHRIGRTARAGEEGKAISILASRDHDNFRRLLAEQQVTITELERPYVERARIQIMDRRDGRRPEGNEGRRFGGREGGRGFGGRDSGRGYGGREGGRGFGGRDSGRGFGGRFGGRDGPRSRESSGAQSFERHESHHEHKPSEGFRNRPK